MDDFTRAIRSVVQSELELMDALDALRQGLYDVRRAIGMTARALWNAQTVGFRAVRIVRRDFREAKRARPN